MEPITNGDVSGDLREIQYGSRELHQLASALKDRSGEAATVVILGEGTRDQKIQTAETIAKELSRDLVRVDLGRVVGKFIAETEKNLHRVFDDAARANAVLFFDEADALFGRRTEVKPTGDRYDPVETLLQHIDAYSGIVFIVVSDVDPAREWAKRLRRASTVVIRDR